MENTPKGHRDGPYIIISKKGRKLYAVSCSSKNNNPLMKYKIDSDKYCFDRDSYAYLGKIEKIDKRRIIKKIDVIDDFDYDRLYKTLYVMKNKYNIINEMGEFNTIFYCDVGDILNYYHKIFYIYDKDNMYLYGDYYNGLNPISKNMIKNTIYYLGGNNSKSGSAGVYYNWERGTIVYSGRSTSWTGKIALIYPSDIYYTYSLGVDDACYIDGSNCVGSSGKTNSWFYNSNYSSQWYISPYSSMSYAVFRYWVGSVNNDYPNQSYGVCPTLYISPSVKIISGTGKSDDPYQLSID